MKSDYQTESYFAPLQHYTVEQLLFKAVNNLHVDFERAFSALITDLITKGLFKDSETV